MSRPLEPESAIPAGIDRRALVRDAVRYTSLLGALTCALAAAFAGPDLSIAVGVGTGFGLVNFVLLARGVGGAIDRTVAGVERTREQLGPAHRRGPAQRVAAELDGANPSEPELAADGLDPSLVRDRPRSAGGSFRLALSVVLVAAALWLLPTDPVGIPVGVILTLIGASVAGVRHTRAQPERQGPRG